MLAEIQPVFMGMARDAEGDAAQVIRNISRHSVWKCGRDTIPTTRAKAGERIKTGAPGGAEIHSAKVEGGEAKHVWKWVKHCASTWFCPVCAPKIMSRRRDEIETAVGQLRDAGYHFAFLTLTIPHTLHVPLVEYMSRLQTALRLFRSGKAWAKFKARTGMLGYIRAQEVMRSKKHGWHPHYHELMILRPDLSEAEAEDAASFMKKRWVDVCKKAGLIPDDKEVAARAHGVDVRLGQDVVSQQYLSKVASWELSSQTTKAARNKESITPFELLGQALDGDKESRRLWAEYMVGMYGRAAVYWSPGLKAFCGVIERTDAELLEGETIEPILAVSGQGYAQVVRRRLQVPLLELSEGNERARIARIGTKIGAQFDFFKPD